MVIFYPGALNPLTYLIFLIPNGQRLSRIWILGKHEIFQVCFKMNYDANISLNFRKDSSIMSMITMVKRGRYFNPSRASPMDITVRQGYRERHEAYIDKQPAVAISTGYCIDSNLIRGKINKSISILFHGQEWERYCCFVTMIFDESKMVAQLFRSALTFSTLPESISAPPTFPNAALSPLSGRHAKINKTPVEKARGALYFSDIGNHFIIVCQKNGGF